MTNLMVIPSVSRPADHNFVHWMTSFSDIDLLKGALISYQ